MRDMICKRPLTASIASFAMGGLLVAVVLSFAETPAPTAPEKTVILSRGMYDNSKTEHKKTVVVPEGVEVEVVENTPGFAPVIKYQGKRYKVPRGLVGNKTWTDIKEDTETHVLVASPGTSVKVVDDSSDTYILIRANGGVYKIAREDLKPFAYTKEMTPEMVKEDPANYAALGEPAVDWIENGKTIPGVKEQEPEALWEKAFRMNQRCPAIAGVASPHIERPKSAVPVWEMLAAYKESDLPAWANRTHAWEDEYKTTVGIIDYVSLRPEYTRWGISIKGGVKGNPNLSCGVLSVQDALEYLWSEKMGFAVKADPELIREAFDNGNRKAGIKWEGKNAQGDPLSENTNTRLLEYLHNDGGYSVLKAESRKKISEKNLPKLVARELSLGYLDFKHYIKLSSQENKSSGELENDARVKAEQKNGMFKSAPLPALMIDELKKGRVILAAGAQAMPQHLPATNKIQSWAGGAKSSYPFPKMGGRMASHIQLITGYYVHYDLSAFPKSGGLFWEFRGNWGTSYGDEGYAYVPNDDLLSAYSTELLSLSLE